MRSAALRHETRDSGADLERLLERLQRVAREVAGIEGVGLDTELGPGLGLDSLGVVELLAAVEDEFGVEFAREEAAAVRTVSDVIALLAARA
jgi:acyl carrier protein